MSLAENLVKKPEKKVYFDDFEYAVQVFHILIYLVTVY